MALTADDATRTIEALRTDLAPLPALKAAFERIYRPDLERVDAAAVEFSHSAVFLRRFLVRGRVFELAEIQDARGLTDRVLLIDLQQERVMQFRSYLEAEMTMVDKMQEELT